ncbi:interferon-induced, double-stranded RNA-activated protein kinase-like [Macrosteles quadrilineatus]|uniref:interferon-induced, double-stranded RNA-activated protein kinase-like n=1 Tax=Macrosteles quadrilineatus TaxID=74068 RepID=UPI0023E350E8|nr:interferon-induced, double-stranded RNA-activated protein kinase-like [Macrosteles quadrilineatus]XP_054280811.1 interferon-induced, double-stranded RNA-activated protein kinase-like [Macrosteles quadrilineatus]
MATKDNPVGFLQELCQKHGYAFPLYKEVDVTGPDHERSFTVKCTFQKFEAIGKARTKKEAKSNAAKNMILVSEQFLAETVTRKENKKLHSPENTSYVGTKNAVSVLNEFSQKLCLQPPKFEVVSGVHGFDCSCTFQEKTTYGHGYNKKSAKTESANKMCIVLKLKHEIDNSTEDEQEENKSKLPEFVELQSPDSRRPALSGTSVPNGVKYVNQTLSAAPIQEFLQVYEEEGKDEGSVSNDQQLVETQRKLKELNLEREN